MIEAAIAPAPPAESDPGEPGPAGPLRVLLEPEQQMIGEGIYEVAFIADADGLPLEFIRVIRHGR